MLKTGERLHLLPLGGQRPALPQKRRHQTVDPVCGIARQSQVQGGQPIGGELQLVTPLDLLGEPRPQVPGRYLHRLGAHPVGDILAIDHKIPAALVLPTDHQMHMRVVGVVVLASDPLEARAQILLHVRHELLGEGLEIEPLGAFRRDDETEMMAIVGYAFGEVEHVLTANLPAPVEHDALTLGAFATTPDVAQVSAQRTRRLPARPRSHDSCLHRDALAS